MEVWRLTSARYPGLDGEGARRYGGRWNKIGTAIVYTAGTQSLAILEYMVHADSDILPTNVVVREANIPGDLQIETISVNDLPTGWREPLDHPALQAIGTDWVNRHSSAVLRVPSAIVPMEHNYLLNPMHRAFAKITWTNPVPFTLDPRLFTR